METIGAYGEEVRGFSMDDVPCEVRWNGRTVTGDESTKRIDFHGHVPPRMSRPPDESYAKIRGGHKDKNGNYVEGEWEWVWKRPNPAPEEKESSAPKETPETPKNKNK